MTSNNEPTPAPTSASSDTDLIQRTLRLTGLLVAGCVLFVGVLSVAAVAVTSRVVQAPEAAEASAHEGKAPAKKPLSI